MTCLAGHWMGFLWVCCLCDVEVRFILVILHKRRPGCDEIGYSWDGLLVKLWPFYLGISLLVGNDPLVTNIDGGSC